MPQRHGFDMIKQIRKKHINVPIIVCSAYHGMKKDDNMKFYNIATFLEKPLEADLLKNKIKELLN